MPMRELCRLNGSLLRDRRAATPLLSLQLQPMTFLYFYARMHEEMVLPHALRR